VKVRKEAQAHVSRKSQTVAGGTTFPPDDMQLEWDSTRQRRRHVQCSVRFQISLHPGPSMGYFSLPPNYLVVYQ